MDTINGKPLSQFGATMLSGAYAELMTPAPLKSFLENKDRSKDGTDVFISNPRQDEKEVTLNFIITGSSQAEYISRYNAFLSELYTGQVSLFVEDLNQTFRLLYSSVTKFGNYRLHACEIALKFREPNPTNRSNL